MNLHLTYEQAANLRAYIGCIAFALGLMFVHYMKLRAGKKKYGPTYPNPPEGAVLRYTLDEALDEMSKTFDRVTTGMPDEIYLEFLRQEKLEIDAILYAMENAAEN